MIIMGWNCRGLGSSSAIRVLCELIKAHKPDIVLLFKTLINSYKLEEIRLRIGFDCCFAADCRGRSGGIGIFWRNYDLCSLISYSTTFVNLDVHDDDLAVWRITAFYGYSERSRRRASWDMLRSIGQDVNSPWLCIGDFNDLLSQDDKIGLHEHPDWCIRGFREVVVDCNLLDMPLLGYLYTWSQSRGKPNAVGERLDRALVTPNWLSLYPDAHLINGLAPISDHSPFFLKTCDTVAPRRQSSFKFENKWLREEGIEDVVREGWLGTGWASLMDKSVIVRRTSQHGKEIWH